MQIILFILILLFAVILIIFTMFRKLLSFIFGGFKGQQQGRQYQRGSRGQQTYNSASTEQQDTDKVFSKDEGEYTSYEEIE